MPDKTLIVVLFIVLAILSGAVLVGNREASNAAKDAAKEAKQAVIAANEAKNAVIDARSALNQHRLRSDVEHPCFLAAIESIQPDRLALYTACVAERSHTPSPNFLPID